MPGEEECPQTESMEQNPETVEQNTETVAQIQDPGFKESKGECLLFFVYRSEWDRRLRNAFIKFKGRLRSYEGQILGISPEVAKVSALASSPWCLRNDWLVAALVFPTQFKARRWFEAEPEVKQHDFPPPSDGCMVFSVPVRYIPKPGRMTFCWTEIADIRDKGAFQSEFVDKVTNLFDTKGVNHGVVFIKDKEQNQLDRLKDCWLEQNLFYRLDLYTSETEFQEIYESGHFQSLKESRDGLSETTSVLFTLDPRVS